MKTRIIALIGFVAIFLSTQYASATIRRVGYFGTALVNVDYINLQSAHDACATGDTISIFPGSWSGTYTKKIVTIGYGYFVTGAGSNPNLQNITNSLTINVTLNAGSDYSIFTGLDGLTIGETPNMFINNIFINRCNISSITFNNKTYTNWQITQCYISGLNGYSYGGLMNNLLVSNCHITSSCGFVAASAQTGVFSNNTFTITPNMGSGSFLMTNNIFVYGLNSQSNCVFQNNLGNSDYAALPGGNGNVSITGALMNSTVFVGFSTQGIYSNDGRYVLKAGSPAIGAGTSGTDCGMYGGTNSYRLSGIPSIPSFYKLTAASTNTSGNPYTITFSVSSNN